VHLDAGYDCRPRRDELAERNLRARISRRGQPAPVQVGKRWVVERANSWLNDFGAAFGATPTPAAMPRTETAARSALVQRGESGVEDRVLGQGPAGDRGGLEWPELASLLP
jgi:hypothetical protein